MIDFDSNNNMANAVEMDRALTAARVEIDKNPRRWLGLGIVMVGKGKNGPDVRVNFRVDGEATTKVLLLGAIDMLKDHILSQLRGLYT